MILFHYEAPRTIFWLRKEESPLPTWIQDNVDSSSRGVGVAFFLFGVGLSGYWLSRTLNTVRQLVLRKGGKHLTIVTYGVLGRSSKFTTIPLAHCSASMYNLRGRPRFFLRVKERHFKYQVNVQDGVFTNKPL